MIILKGDHIVSMARGSLTGLGVKVLNGNNMPIPIQSLAGEISLHLKFLDGQQHVSGFNSNVI